jgi:hypothetical protein
MAIAVMMETRTPAKLTDWNKQNPAGRTGRFADAAQKRIKGAGILFLLHDEHVRLLNVLLHSHAWPLRIR